MAFMTTSLHAGGGIPPHGGRIIRNCHSNATACASFDLVWLGCYCAFPLQSSAKNLLLTIGVIGNGAGVVAHLRTLLLSARRSAAASVSSPNAAKAAASYRLARAA